jgi:hypothetical protein
VNIYSKLEQQGNMRSDCSSILNKSSGTLSIRTKRLSAPATKVEKFTDKFHVATHFAYFFVGIVWSNLSPKVVPPSGRMQLQVSLAGTIDRNFCW